MTTEQVSSVDLPSDMIIEIFSYLPVKSLYRFKAVSKSVYVLIQHHRFVKLHASHSKRQHLICYNNSHMDRIDLQSSLKPKSFTFADSKVVPTRVAKTRNMTCYGPSNGLFYFADTNNVNNGIGFICNPTSGEKLKVRDHIFRHSFDDYMFLPKKHEQNGCFQTSLTGFCYVASIDDYRFVRIFSKKFLHYYSCDDKMWFVIRKDFDFQLPSDNKGVSFNGRIHWGGRVRGSITAFDVEKMNFETLALPNLFHSATHHCHIYSVEQFFCVSFDNHVGFWIMKEYGVHQSWTRIVVWGNPFTKYVPLCVWDNEETVFFSERRVFCRDKGGKIHKEFVFDSKDYQLITSAETLVSPILYHHFKFRFNQIDVRGRKFKYFPI